MIMGTKKKKKVYLFQILSIALYLGLGIYSGYLLSSVPEEYNIVGELAILYISLFFAFFFTIIVHESGHLVFGLISGYKFVSFRIMSFMWVKENGKISLKRFSVAGTGGQCLMSPPDMIDGKIPVVLYNLGGSLMNIIVSVLLYLTSIVVCSPLVVCVLRIIAAFGVVLALLNGIPLKTSMVNNDGYNAVSLSKNPKAMHAFWLQMRINDMVSQGYRLKDMPDEWFVLPSDEEMPNVMISTLGIFCCNRLMDQHRFAEADVLMKHYTDMDVLVGIHRGLVVCDRIYCEIMGENRKDIIDEMLTKEQKQFMRAMRTTITVLRTEYLYSLLCENDKEKAEKIKLDFEKSARKYPYVSDIESERELIAIAEEK